MKSLADRMSELLQQEKYRKSNSHDYVQGYVEGVLDMHNEAKRHIKEEQDVNTIPDTQVDKGSDTECRDSLSEHDKGSDNDRGVGSEGGHVEGTGC